MYLKIGEIKEEIKIGSILWIATNLKISKIQKCECEECILVEEFFTGAISLKIIEFFTVETMRNIEDNKITIFINDDDFYIKLIIDIKRINKNILFSILDLKIETI